MCIWRINVLAPIVFSCNPVTYFDARGNAPFYVTCFKFSVTDGNGLLKCCIYCKKIAVLMAKELRRSSRTIKKKQEPGFIYEEESVNNILARSSEKDDNRQLRQSSESENSVVFNSAVEKCSLLEPIASETWTDLHSLPTYFNRDYYSLQRFESRTSICSSISQREFPNTLEFEFECFAGSSTSEVNKVGAEISHRRSSSTRLDFLDRDRLLTVSSTVRTDTSNMGSESDESVIGQGLCNCKIGSSCSKCSAASSKSESPDLNTLVKEMLHKVNELSVHVTSLGGRLKSLEQKNNVSSASEEEVSSATVASEKRPKDKLKKLNNKKVAAGGSGFSSSSAAEGRKRSPKDRKGKIKNKSARVDEERARTLKLLLQQMEGYGSLGEYSSAFESQETSDDESKRKKKKKKKQNSPKTPASGKKAGASRARRSRQFDSSSDGSDPDSSSSDTDTESGSGSRRRRKKVKSGANVKKRPVKKTELWPHTIANEDGTEGTEVTSENISLAEFLICFSHIMIASKKVESAGRSLLLNAISSVLKCVPWAEARGFHNSVMYKIEQGKLDWNSDFTDIGKEFLDKKVRLNLRANAAGPYSSNRYNVNNNNNNNNNNNHNRNFGRNYNSNNRSNYDSNQFKSSLHTIICHQWNAGSCSWGANCKRWHTCKLCADAGKLGENHRACSHDGYSSRFRQSEQRV